MNGGSYYNHGDLTQFPARHGEAKKGPRTCRSGYNRFYLVAQCYR